MTAKIMDQYNGDASFAELYVLIKDRPLVKDMLKSASFQEKKAEIEALPSTAFAWEDERRFPIHTKEDALASILYRSKLASKVPAHVDDKLGQAAEVYGISDHIFSNEKTAMAQEVEYALPEHKRLPLGDAGQVKLAEHVLTRDVERLPLETRADAFSRLALGAEKHGVELAPLTRKLAGITMSHRPQLQEWLGARASAASKAGIPSIAEAFDKLAESLVTTPEFLTNRKGLTKLASTIYELDKAAGLDKFYDRKLPDPLLTVFNTEKTAEEMCDVGGKMTPVSALMSLPTEVWADVDAPELAELAEAGDPVMFKQVFDTMPLDIKAVLQHYV